MVIGVAWSYMHMEFTIRKVVSNGSGLLAVVFPS